MSVLHHLGKNYYIPEHVIKNYAHLYCDDDWGYTTAYYFKKKRKTIVKPEEQKADYTVSKLSKYENDTFYKLTNESRKSKLFDYFIKLKDKSPRIVILKNNVHSEELKPEKYVSEYGKLDTKQIKVQF